VFDRFKGISEQMVVAYFKGISDIANGRGAKIKEAKSSGRKILSGGAFYLLALNTDLASCQPSGAKNSVVASRFWKICAFLVKDISFIYLVSEYDIW